MDTASVCEYIHNCTDLSELEEIARVLWKVKDHKYMKMIEKKGILPPHYMNELALDASTAKRIDVIKRVRNQYGISLHAAKTWVDYCHSIIIRP